MKALLLVLLFACSALAQQSNEAITIHVYRYKEFGIFNVKFPIFLDDKEVARIENGRYFVITAPAGKHILRSNDNRSGVEITAPETFVRIDLGGGGAKTRGQVVVVQPEQARVELKKVRYSDRKDIKDTSLVAPPAT